jgi:hypothetical protein
MQLIRKYLLQKFKVFFVNPAKIAREKGVGIDTSVRFGVI